MSTTIEWTQRPGTKGETWNPFAAFDKETGKRGWICQLVSPGCANCYAQTFNLFRGNGHPYQAGELDKVRIELVNVDQPGRWRHPRTVFVCSMTDLFFEGYSDEQIGRVFDVMAATPQHTYQVLTKRPERMRELVTRFVENNPASDGAGVLPNVWLGTSVENQACADKRIPFLLDTPAAVRFLSCEPLFGPIDLEQYLIPAMRVSRAPSDVPPSRRRELSAEDVRMLSRLGRAAMRQYGDQEFVDWVIVGGESGPGARPCDVAHVGSLVEQCKGAGVAVFVKQLGAFVVSSNCADWIGHRGHDALTGNGLEQRWRIRLNDTKGGDIGEWPEDLRVREWPSAEAHV